jgi:hypothetical protein
MLLHHRVEPSHRHRGGAGCAAAGRSDLRDERVESLGPHDEDGRDVARAQTGERRDPLGLRPA